MALSNPKTLMLLTKAVARHTIYHDPILTVEDIQKTVLADLPLATVAQFVQELQGSIAIAAHLNQSSSELSASLKETSLSEVAQEAVSTWWGDNREAVLSHLAELGRASRPSLEDLQFRISTHTASSRDASAGGGGGGGEAEPAVTLDFTLRDRGGDAATSRTFSAAVQKSMLIDMLTSIGNLRREVEKPL